MKTDRSSLFRELLSSRVLVFDGATGTNLQTQNLSAADFGGPEYDGCNEYLVVTCPDAVRTLHRGFLEAGADIIETDSFGSTRLVLSEYNLQERAYELNFRAAELARGVAEEFSTPEKPRFVAGSIGPTTKLPSLGHVTFEEMRDAYREQIAGLIEGGADILCIETCQDLLQVKCALAAAESYCAETSQHRPLIVSITIETMGTMLMGTEIGAALSVLEPYDIVDVIGINCATGPMEMDESVRFLAANSRRPIFVMPNAGLPENIDGRACYRLQPDELHRWIEHFVRDLGVSIIGGCCGTTPEHIRRLSEIASAVRPAIRTVDSMPSVASIYSPVPLRIDRPPLLIGERCNANG